ncbi:dialkylresorcinol condensing enzyme [Pasteurellaceae bacterium RH1A]|nr:dialkylresorcinol condensing enzyme [Pasteurellaceae bacterium RH1A]
MTKKILLISYSQTGQLTQLADNFIQPLKEVGLDVEEYVVKPLDPYRFPWKFETFFNTFPETVHLQPKPIEKPVFQREKYDLIIIAYSVWFLSPAQPITAFMQTAEAKKILQDTPVITLIGCRNMWLQAQEKMKKLIADGGGKLVGNVVKVDQSNAWASFITTPAWMFTGNKQHFASLPSAGISEAELADMQRFGQALLQKIQQNQPLDQPLFQGMGAVKIDEKLMMSEKVGHRSFYLWGKLLIKCGQISPHLRRFMLYFYIVFLVCLILTVVPISAVLKHLLRPLLKKKLAQQKEYYAQPSGE